MQILEIVFLIVAYTLGIVTLTFQIICYFREIEYKETLFLSVSFLSLIVMYGVIGFLYTKEEMPAPVFRFILSFLSIALATAIPLNIHKERVVSRLKLRNQILITLSLLLLAMLIATAFLGYWPQIEAAIMIFLLVSILYSMGLSVMSPPSLLIKHREKIEKLTGIILLVFIPLYAGLGLANNYFTLWNSSLFESNLIISMIFIGLASTKLADDIKRLSLISPNANNDTSSQLDNFNITKREKEVTALLMKGYSYKKIAEELFISLPTVKTHISNIYKKTEVKNKVELINLLTPNTN
ncbi:MAG: helix-turn-helix transcriptional regulator [Bacteroidia bacterium]|nr:helix-turn-helix transcriptional regulator [Bacteroidia bacterium]